MSGTEAAAPATPLSKGTDGNADGSRPQERRSSVGGETKRFFTVSSEAKRQSLPDSSRRASLPSSLTSIEQLKRKTDCRSPVPARNVAAAPRPNSSSSRSASAITASQLVNRSRNSPMSVSSGRESSSARNTESMSSLSLSSQSVGSGSRLRSSTSRVVASKSRAAAGDRDKVSTAEIRDTSFLVLPQVEIKPGDDLRLDLRGHRISNIKSSSLNLSRNLEFVYLRDNLLSSLEGVQILKNIKVLDLSFNQLKGPCLEPLGNCKFLQQLYLAGNKITSLASLPELPNLEFLSVAQNKLKSLAMAVQPHLQVLAASKNKIVTLKGFPFLPVLEHLRVEENPILEMPHLEAALILLIGVTLKKYNDKDLSPEEQELAKLYPPQCSICIRDGWQLCRPELAADSTFQFLVAQWKNHLPPGYHLKEASVDKPYEDDACHCHFTFVKDLTNDHDGDLNMKFQWFIAERAPTNFMPISGAVEEVYWPNRGDINKILKVECTPMLGEQEYPTIYAVSDLVNPGTGCPKVIKLIVEGELVEGNVIRGLAMIAWCGGTPAKGLASWLRQKWNSNPVIIVGAEDMELRLTVDDIDSRLVLMYTPITEEGLRGEPHYAMTDFVKAALPSVKNVRILEDAIEGNTVVGLGEYFGGKEGPSKYQWMGENMETGKFTLVSTGTCEYMLTKKDVGTRMMFVYIPVNFEGLEGKSASAITGIVRKAPPRATSVKIIGDLREGSKLTVTAAVVEGLDSACRVQWFKSSSSTLDDKIGLVALSTLKISKVLQIPLGAVGHFIVAKFVPVAPDGESGEPAYVITEKIVESLPPSISFLSITGDYYEGQIITASYGYVGGHEGCSTYNWYLHESEDVPGFLLSDGSGLLQYCITKDAVGKLISFRCTPVRDDGMVGEPKTCIGQELIQPGTPTLLSLELHGPCVEGSTLQVDKNYWGGIEGESNIRWFQIKPDGSQWEINSATSLTYTLSHIDIGSTIAVSYEPIRSDSARGHIVLSNSIGPILPGPPTCEHLDFCGSMIEGERIGFSVSYFGGEEGRCTHEWFRLKNDGLKERLSSDEYLDLTLEDVGVRIELAFFPVRIDGVKGRPKIIVSDVVSPADPMGVALCIPDGFEDKEMVPEKSYYGGLEGIGEYTWFRCARKFEESDIRNLPIPQADVFIVGSMMTYTPNLDDVGTYLALCWVPSRDDGKRGSPLVSVCKSPVSPGLPVVSNVCLLESSSGVYSGKGNYYGGYEGSSLFSWYRQPKEGTIFLIEGADSMSYQVTEADYNCRLLFGYAPIRADSLMGKLTLSEPSDIILPEIIKIQQLLLTGKAIEGETLTALPVIPGTEMQQLLWEKYKKDIKYKWSLVTGSGQNESNELLSSQDSCSYYARLEDINHCIKCQCIVTDVFERSSQPAYASSPPIVPGIPKISKLEIEGRGFHTNLYGVHGAYTGGKEGKSTIQWLRAMIGSPDLIPIQGEIGPMYEANVDDVGYRLVAIYTPIRDDGVVGQPVSASTESITVEPGVLKEVKENLDIGAVKFEVLRDRDQSSKMDMLVVGGLERRTLELNKKRIKVLKPGSKTSFPTTEVRGTYAPPFHVEISRNDLHRLKIVVDSKSEVDLIVQTRHMRDVIVLVIRGFAQRYNSTSLNSLLKIEP